MLNYLLAFATLMMLSMLIVGDVEASSAEEALTAFLFAFNGAFCWTDLLKKLDR